MAECEDQSDKVVVIDNIQDPKQFRVSDKIRKETRKFKDLPESQFAYSLPRGGVSLQFNTKEEADKVLNN